MHSVMLGRFFAAQLSTWDQLKKIPGESWLNLLICVVAVVLVLRLWRALKKLNDFAPYIFAVMLASSILFLWVYERNEPSFMTPVVERLAMVLPTKAKQQQSLEQWHKSRRD